MTPIKLFLDDARAEPQGWAVCRSFQEFKTFVLQNPEIEVISFDHDLEKEHYAIDFEMWELMPEIAGVAETGYDCAKWLLNHLDENPKIKVPKMFVHSANPAGSKNILYLINRWLLDKALKNDCVRVNYKNLI